MVNEEKTKYMCLNRQKSRDRLGQNVTVDTYTFERVERLMKTQLLSEKNF